MKKIWTLAVAALVSLALWPSAGQAQFTYETNNGTITITGYAGPVGHVAIPDTINGLPVTSIEGWTRDRTTEVSIPNSVTNIGPAAFEGCLNLTAIAIPHSILSIGAYAFGWCTNLTSIFIPNSVTSIGGGVFGTCLSLTNAIVEEGIRTIAAGMFGGCAALPSIAIPSTVTSIGDSAFGGCSSLTSIQIPDSVAWIGEGAFEGCVNLTNVSVGHGWTTVAPWLFSGCTSLTYLPLPPNVSEIGEGAFSQCAGLTRVRIPDGVTNIGTRAFADCTNLKSVILPDTVATIQGTSDDAFWNYEDCWRQGAFMHCVNLTNVVLGMGLKELGDCSFLGCSSLVEVEIPASVTHIGDWVFDDCASLERITVPESNQAYCSVDGVLLGKSQTTLIKYPQAATGAYVLPSSVTNIANGAFAGCCYLRDVSLGSSVGFIGVEAFRGCSNLVSLAIPANARLMTVNWLRSGGGGFGYWQDIFPLSRTFADCTKLKEVKIGEGVSMIPAEAFSGCCSLKSVTIPKTVTRIGLEVFAGCTNIMSVYFEGDAPSLDNPGPDGYGPSLGYVQATVYYLPGNSGWGTWYGWCPTAPWYQPQPLVLPGSIIVSTNTLNFRISWATNVLVVVEASTDLATWLPLRTNSLLDGSCDFTESGLAVHQRRFYRVRSY